MLMTFFCDISFKERKLVHGKLVIRKICPGKSSLFMSRYGSLAIKLLLLDLLLLFKKKSPQKWKTDRKTKSVNIQRKLCKKGTTNNLNYCAVNKSNYLMHLMHENIAQIQELHRN